MLSFLSFESFNVKCRFWTGTEVVPLQHRYFKNLRFFFRPERLSDFVSEPGCPVRDVTLPVYGPVTWTVFLERAVLRV